LSITRSFSSRKNCRNNEIKFRGILIEDFNLQYRVAKYASEGRIEGEMKVKEDNKSKN